MRRPLQTALIMVACGAALLGNGPLADTATISGKVTCRGVRDCAGAVVYIAKIPGRTFSPTTRAIMDQVRLTFDPLVLPVVVGTQVAFPNNDEVRHNVFSPSPVKRFNLGTYPKGVTKHVVFDNPGVVELLCNVHAEMSAYIVVTETPYVAHVAAGGSYALRNAPAGTYDVCGWRPELKAHCTQVAVRDRDTVQLNIELRR